MPLVCDFLFGVVFLYENKPILNWIELNLVSHMPASKEYPAVVITPDEEEDEGITFKAREALSADEPDSSRGKYIQLERLIACMYRDT